jgi:hypothetical protein
MRAVVLTGVALAVVAVAACFGPGPQHREPDTSDAGGTDLTDGGVFAIDVDLGDPFQLNGLTPSHGSFLGGTRTTLAGRGFTSQLRVKIGGADVPKSDIFASDPTRAALTTPAHPAGAVDVVIRDEGTLLERTLKNGFVYDALDVLPNTGATSGGTRVAVRGSGTTFGVGTTVTIDGKPCTDVAVTSPTALECTTPAAAPGAKDVKVTYADATDVTARDAFTYSDSSDGFRGGLSGGVLNGTVKVIILDNYTGFPVPGATVIVGTGTTGQTALTNGNGVATLTSPTYKGAVTVTGVEKCHQPTTFVDVPVDTVTFYLNPIMDLSCADGDPPSGTGKPRDVGVVTGELVWNTGGEFQTPNGWPGVPEPVRSTERKAAYVFAASGSPLDGFYLPDPKTATTLGSAGVRGYSYAYVGYPGTVNLYALAGVEDSAFNPPKFTPFAMGVVRGVPVAPKTTTTLVDIPMNALLDHQVTVNATPPIGSPGPDRIETSFAVGIGPSSYAILPNAKKTTFLPMSAPAAFVGVPPLSGSLTGETYVLTGNAATGSNLIPPASVVARVRTNDGNGILSLTGFLNVPNAIAPGAALWDGKSVQIGALPKVDLVELYVSSGGGLVAWTIVAPGTAVFPLPDLPSYDPKFGLIHGSIRSYVYAARISGFSYDKLRYGQLGSQTWDAYAIDAKNGAY